MPVFVIPNLHTVNPLNRREHWRKRAARTKQERDVTRQCTLAALGLDMVEPPCLVTLTRIAPRMLDPGDNLSASLKAVRDGVADALKVDDGDPSVAYLPCKQEKGRYAVKVEITKGADMPNVQKGTVMADMIDISGLWKKDAKSGTRYWGGKARERIVIEEGDFINLFTVTSDNSKAPAFNLKLSRARKEDAPF